MPAHNPFDLVPVPGGAGFDKNGISDPTTGLEAEASEAPEEGILDGGHAGFARKVQEFHGHRAIKIWLIIMISLRVRPISSVHDELWKASSRFRNLFRERLRYIKANLTAIGESGLILYFPNHPGSEPTNDLEDEYIDVVSAIAVLRRKYSDLPIEINALVASAANLPIATSWYAEGVGPIDQPSAIPASRRDQTKAIVGRMNNNLQSLLLRLVEHHYGTLSPQTIGSIKDSISQEIQSPGLGPAAIETQLRLLLAHRDSVSRD